MDAFDLELAERAWNIPLETIQRMPTYEELVIDIDEMAEDHGIELDGSGLIDSLAEKMTRRIVNERLMVESVVRASVRQELFDVISSYRVNSEELSIIDFWQRKYGRNGLD